MSEPGPVFIVGATGYTGREVVRACSERGLPTIAHVRPDSHRLAQWRERFEDLGATVDTTAWDAAEISSTLTRVAPRAVYALLGTTKARGRDGLESTVPDTYEAVDYGLSVMLLAAARACGSRPRFVYLSAMGADGRSVNAYMEARVRVEREVRDSGLPFVLARPGFITGDDRDESRPIERVGALVGDGLLGVLGALGAKRLRDRFSSLSGTQLGDALVRITCEAAEDVVVAESLDLQVAARSRPTPPTA